MKSLGKRNNKLALFQLVSAILIVSSSYLTAQQVRINEVVADNSLALDDDGDSPDWLELRNFSGNPISLEGWQLTDDLTAEAYWTFPDITLGADQHLRIWASGKDRDNLLTPRTFLTQGDPLKYLIPTQNLSSAWKTIGFDDSSWSTGNSGFGYNDGDDNTQVPGGTTAVFVRKEFTIADINAIQSLIFDVDYDDGFVAYINGVEIARANITGTNPPFNASTITDREAQIYSGGLPERFILNDPTAILQDGENVLAIQVHNISSNSSDMSLIPFLSAIYTSPTTEGGAPDVLIPLPEGGLHTDFKISASGETLYLLNETGTIIDSLATGTLPPNISRGIPYNFEDQYALFPEPSPGQPNLGSFYDGIIEQSVTFSHPGGSTGEINLSLSGATGPAVIRYTVDASVPTENSPRYFSPIRIEENTVVRAKIFRNNYLPSPTESRTYIIDNTHSLPIISLVTAPENLFDQDEGIYVLGNNAQTDFPFFGSNFWEDWERPVHVSLYENDGDLGFALNGGIKIFGGWSRGLPQRSFSLFARKRYGANSIEYPLFPTRPHQEYQAFILRNSGNDFLNSNLRDVTLTSLMEGSGLEIQANRPAATYINGEYWGFYNMREKINEHFIGAKYGLAPDEINIVELDGRTIHGDNTPYLDLMQFVSVNNLASSANYNQVAQQIDIENFIIYNVAQIYFNNTDWPGNNIKFWQPVGGKWRWILFDTDFGFGVWNPTDYFNNTLNFALEANGPNWPNPPWSTLLLRRLIQNTEFRHQFINRYADELNSRFLPNRVQQHIDTMSQRISSEIGRHYDRWEGNTSGWWSQVNNMRTFGNLRPQQAKEHILSTFNLEDYHRLTITIEDTSEGFVRINNRLTIDENSWNGDYFEGVPFALEAFALPGYTFSHWESSQGQRADAAISVNITTAASYRPVFTVDAAAELPIVINEINYNSPATFDSGDWIELYNPNGFSVNISGWTFKDDDDSHEFILPSGTIMAADSYWIITRNKAQFQSLHPTLNQVIGDFTFGLSSGGDAVRLYNAEAELQDEVYYLPESPWPTAANGQGPTLELISPDLDNSLPESWTSAGSGHGSPGALNFSTNSTLNSEITEYQYFPNPFSGQVNLRFHLRESSSVTATLYDTKGAAVHSIVNDNLSAGQHEFSAALGHLPNGVYFLEIRTDKAVSFGKRWIKMR